MQKSTQNGKKLAKSGVRETWDARVYHARINHEAACTRLHCPLTRPLAQTRRSRRLRARRTDLRGFRYSGNIAACNRTQWRRPLSLSPRLPRKSPVSAPGCARFCGAVLIYLSSMSTNKRHTISSFAAPTPQDKAAFELQTLEEKRELLAAEIEKGLEGTPRKVSAEDIIAAVRARLAHA